MTEQFILALVASVAVVFGAMAGRVLAVEAEHRIAGILAAAYVGAGVGLVCALTIGSVFAVGAIVWSSHELATMFEALEATGTVLMLGVAGGAAGGLAIGIVVAALKTSPRNQP